MSDPLKRNAARKRQETFNRAERGIKQLLEEDKPITFSTVAQASGVSKAWLYKEPEIRAQIEDLRKQSLKSSKQTRIAALLQRVEKLEAENAQLKRQMGYFCRSAVGD